MHKSKCQKKSFLLLLIQHSKHTETNQFQTFLSKYVLIDEIPPLFDTWMRKICEELFVFKKILFQNQNWEREYILFMSGGGEPALACCNKYNEWPVLTSWKRHFNKHSIWKEAIIHSELNNLILRQSTYLSSVPAERRRKVTNYFQILRPPSPVTNWAGY